MEDKKTRKDTHMTNDKIYHDKDQNIYKGNGQTLKKETAWGKDTETNKSRG